MTLLFTFFSIVNILEFETREALDEYVDFLVERYSHYNGGAFSFRPGGHPESWIITELGNDDVIGSLDLLIEEEGVLAECEPVVGMFEDLPEDFPLF